MANPLDTMFKGIGGVQPPVDANYVQPGRYICRIDRIKTDMNRKNEAFLAVEMTVLHVLDDDHGQGHSKQEQVTQMFWQKHVDMFQKNVKKMIMGITGASSEEVTEEHCQRIVSDEQPLKGVVTEIYAYTIMTKANKPFTKVIFERSFQSQEEIESRVKEFEEGLVV